MHSERRVYYTLNCTGFLLYKYRQRKSAQISQPLRETMPPK